MYKKKVDFLEDMIQEVSHIKYLTHNIVYLFNIYKQI